MRAKNVERLEEHRRVLIDGTIRVIAAEGLDKATTKQIGTLTSTNEAYIYRCFKDKEDMFAQTFAFLDEELVLACLSPISIMYMEDLEYETRCRLFFSSVWKFLLGNSDKCFAFIRLYYSPYFVKYSAEEHKSRFAPFLDKFKVSFREEANVWMILNHILDTMLAFAVKVFNGEVPNDANTEEHVFRVIYASVKQYFKKEQ